MMSATDFQKAQECAVRLCVSVIRVCALTCACVRVCIYMTFDMYEFASKWGKMLKMFVFGKSIHGNSIILSVCMLCV